MMRLQDILSNFFGTNPIASCVMCSGELNRKPCYYTHPNGLELTDFKEPQWVFFVCKKCHYENSFVKLFRKWRNSNEFH